MTKRVRVFFGKKRMLILTTEGKLIFVKKTSGVTEEELTLDSKVKVI